LAKFLIIDVRLAIATVKNVGNNVSLTDNCFFHPSSTKPTRGEGILLYDSLLRGVRGAIKWLSQFRASG